MSRLTISRPVCSQAFLSKRQWRCIGQIPIDHVTFDPTKRKALDASCLDSLLAEQELTVWIDSDG
jgi:hypothetical protein